MRDPIERPNTARYARGSTRHPASRRAGKSQAGEATIVSAADPPQTSGRDLVAEKLSGFDRMTLDWSQVHDYTVATIQEALIERRVPAEHLTQPRLDITVPALEAMRYSGLKREFALLIASTMDKTRSDEAHPAFIEILKQLTLDEATLLSVFPGTGQAVPMATLFHLDRSGRIRSSLRHIIPDAFARTCQRPSAIPGYIDNLIRLNLIASPPRLRIDDERFYRDLLSQEFVARHIGSQAGHLKASVEKDVLTLTDFGSQFRNCCLDGTLAGSRALKPD